MALIISAVIRGPQLSSRQDTTSVLKLTHLSLVCLHNQYLLNGMLLMKTKPLSRVHISNFYKQLVLALSILITECLRENWNRNLPNSTEFTSQVTQSKPSMILNLFTELVIYLNGLRITIVKRASTSQWLESHGVWCLWLRVNWRTLEASPIFQNGWQERQSSKT